jgi:excisionase family DNA binding protein
LGGDGERRPGARKEEAIDMNVRTIQMIELALGDPEVTPRQRDFILAACRNPALAVEDSPLEMEPAATLAEAAATLGVSYRSVQRWVASGALRTRRVMGRLYVPHSEVRRLMRGEDAQPGRVQDSTAGRDCDATAMADATG